MIKRYILLSILTIPVCTSAQFLTQSADGKSTIPLPLNGAGLGIDIGKTELNFGLNNYQSVLNNQRNWFLGANLAAKNADGLGALFNSGDIVPQGNFLGFIGRSFSNHETLAQNFLGSEFLTADAKYNEKLSQLGDEFKVALKESVLLSSKYIKDDTLQLKTTTDLFKAIDTTLKNKLIPFINSYKPSDEGLKNFLVVFATATKSDIKTYLEKADLARKAFYAEYPALYTKYLTGRSPWRLTFFGMGGIQARSFKRYLGTTAGDFSKSFQDSLFRGGTVGIGINFQYRNYWLGATYSYNNGDNFSSLTSKEYVLKTTDTSGNQSLSSEKKITAYSGKYGQVENNLFNLDLVAEYPIGDTSRLLVNLYMRASWKSRDTAYLKNVTNIGCGFYFLRDKGKFIGGIYIELPDVSNNIQKALPPADQNIRSPLKKLSFGITTKFNLSSIFGWTDRPPSPSPAS